MPNAGLLHLEQNPAYQVKLCPPLPRAMGLKRKISFGAKARPMFHLLYAARRLRGSRLDVFGYHPVRRMERELVVQYRREVEALLPRLSPLTLASAAKIAALPDIVRGYEQIKVQKRTPLPRGTDVTARRVRGEPPTRHARQDGERVAGKVNQGPLVHQVVAAERTTVHVSPSRA
ncbi:DUF6537 domain-containing protein [Streptomyces mirabilis]|uniref:DUF6537 domain-containing protein n=1 Tax=Streptomyces mirabilis TaxID=68239 RepID=UPI0036A82123